MFGPKTGLTRHDRGAFWQLTQSRRRRSRRMMGAGGLMVQFCEKAFSSGKTERHAGLWTATYSADNGAATTALADHVPRTAAGFGAARCPRDVLHVEPVPGACTVAQHVVRVGQHMLVDAVQGRLDQGGAVLQQAGMELATGARQAVERVQVNRLGD